MQKYLVIYFTERRFIRTLQRSNENAEGGIIFHYRKQETLRGFCQETALSYSAGIVLHWGRILSCHRKQLIRVLRIVMKHGKQPL